VCDPNMRMPPEPGVQPLPLWTNCGCLARPPTRSWMGPGMRNCCRSWGLWASGVRGGWNSSLLLPHAAAASGTSVVAPETSDRRRERLLRAACARRKSQLGVSYYLGAGRQPVTALGLLHVAGFGQLGQRGRDRGPCEPGLGGDLAGGHRLAAHERGEH
jgi:hypothetical protein